MIEKSAKTHIVEKSNRGLLKSKKTLLALITLGNSLIVFGAGLYVIAKHPESASFIVSLCATEIQFITALMTAALIGVSCVDFKSVTSLETVAKSELEKHVDFNTVKNIAENVLEKK